MKTLKHVLFMLCCIIGMQAQIKSSPQLEIATIKNYKLKKGRHTAVFKLNNRQSVTTNLNVPNIEPNQKVPLIIALHWAGGLDAYKSYSDCLAFPALEFLNGIIVAPSADGSHWVSEENESKLSQLIKEIKKHWPIDDSKIIITGYSNGGIASWAYAEKYPELFCASIPVSGHYEVAKIKVPTYVIHGKDDELFNAYRVQNIISQSVEKGSNIKFKLIEQSHFMGCSYVEALKEMATLMEIDVLN